MGSPARRLTDLAIRNLKAKPKRQELPDGGARGLYVWFTLLAAKVSAFGTASSASRAN
jgi:hypothetical protein